MSKYQRVQRTYRRNQSNASRTVLVHVAAPLVMTKGVESVIGPAPRVVRVLGVKANPDHMAIAKPTVSPSTRTPSAIDNNTTVILFMIAVRRDMAE